MHNSRLFVTHYFNTIGGNDDLPHAILFMVDTTPRWVDTILSILMTGFLDTTSLMQDAILELGKCNPYTLISRQLYQKVFDEVLCLCIDSNKYLKIIHNSHVSKRGIHLSSIQMTRRVMSEGLWWDTICECTENFVLHCPTCQFKRP